MVLTVLKFCQILFTYDDKRNRLLDGERKKREEIQKENMPMKIMTYPNILLK